MNFDVSGVESAIARSVHMVLTGILSLDFAAVVALCATLVSASRKRSRITAQIMPMYSEEQFKEVARSYEKLQNFCKGAGRAELEALFAYQQMRTDSAKRAWLVEVRKLEIVLVYKQPEVFSGPQDQEP